MLLYFALESGITWHRIQRATETDGQRVASVTIERKELEEEELEEGRRAEERLDKRKQLCVVL